MSREMLQSVIDLKDGDTPYHQRELTIPFYLTHEEDYSIWIYKLIKEISKVVGYNNRHFIVKNLKNEELAIEFIKDLSEKPQNLLNNMKGMAIEVVIKGVDLNFCGGVSDMLDVFRYSVIIVPSFVGKILLKTFPLVLDNSSLGYTTIDEDFKHKVMGKEGPGLSTDTITNKPKA
ncbi:hypothetical protein ACQ2H7_003404 [Candidozyma auris]